MDHAGHDAMAMDEPMATHPLRLPHARHGSGTSWLPDDSRAAHLMSVAGPWTLMGHGAAFAGGIRMNGPRGDQGLYAPNMIMLIADRNAGAATRWRLAGMFSTDAATVRGAGYPLLFQTGETWKGAPLHDHQHPHNLLSELSIAVVHAMTPSAALQLYLAPVGEPALGPPAFPHRPLGSETPLGTIGHHWQDATHIAYGVVTAGIQTRVLQLEGSAFNGREPGEDRLAIDRPELDSASGRLSVNPAPALAFQISHGYLHRPEEAHPEHDTRRTTASALFGHAIGPSRHLDLALVWGRNRIERRDLDAWTLEALWSAETGITPFARAEVVEKDAEELVLPPAFPPERVFTLRQLTVGAVLALPVRGPLAWGVGAQGVVSHAPDALASVYGKNPGGWAAYLRVRPRASDHAM